MELQEFDEMNNPILMYVQDYADEILNTGRKFLIQLDEDLNLESITIDGVLITNDEPTTKISKEIKNLKFAFLN